MLMVMMMVSCWLFTVRILLVACVALVVRPHCPLARLFLFISPLLALVSTPRTSNLVAPLPPDPLTFFLLFSLSGGRGVLAIVLARIRVDVGCEFMWDQVWIVKICKDCVVAFES